MHPKGKHSRINRLRAWRRGTWRRLVGRCVAPPIRCRDEFGRRGTLTVERNADGVVVIPSLPGPLQVEPLDVGRMRAALRDAIVRTPIPTSEELAMYSLNDHAPARRGPRGAR